MTEPLRPGDMMTIRAFDDIPKHLFRVDEVLEDCVTGVASPGRAVSQVADGVGDQPFNLPGSSAAR